MGKKDKSRKRRKGKKDKKKKPTMAERADRFMLYQQSVQCPEAEIEFIESTFKKHRKRKPLSFREDFCGTAFLATEWCKSHKKRTAIGVDLHGPTLDWGRQHVLAPEPESVQQRVTLIQADVRDVQDPKVDVGCALNFSYCVFKTRAELRGYFEVAREGLNDEGMFFCELYGGTEAITELEEERPLDGFTYVWNQAEYNPITNQTLCHIHFDFPDKSRMEEAFTYDWRLWTIPEVRELLEEAGFSKVEVYWDPVDDDGDDTGAFRLTECEENQEGWLVYFVALK